jgi:hypothetical protein
VGTGTRPSHNIIHEARSWSSGYDRRLPSDGPGFNSRRTQFFVGDHPFSFLGVNTHKHSCTLKHEEGKRVTQDEEGGRVSRYTVKRDHPLKRDPGNRSRTSDLEISVVAIYSLPLCQLSYTRMFEL